MLPSIYKVNNIAISDNEQQESAVKLLRDVPSHSEERKVAGKAQDKRRFFTAKEFKQNFKIKIQSSKAFLDKDHSQLQDLMKQIEKDKQSQLANLRMQESKQYLKLSQLNTSSYPTDAINSARSSSQVDGISRNITVGNVMKGSMSVQRPKIHLYSYLQQQRKMINLRQVQLQSQLYSNNYASNEAMAIKDEEQKELGSPSQVKMQLQYNSVQQKQAQKFSHSVLRSIKHSLNNSSLGYSFQPPTIEEHQASVMSMGKATKSVNRIIGAMVGGDSSGRKIDDESLVQSTLSHLPGTKIQEIKKILLNNDSCGAMQICTPNEPVEKEHLIENKVEYSFTIDVFEDNIKFKKSPMQRLIANVDDPNIKSKIAIDNVDKAQGDRSIPFSQTPFSIEVSSKPESRQKQSQARLQVQSNKLIAQSVPTILKVLEEPSLPQGSMSHKMQLEKVRKDITPIFSGNISSFDINRLLQREVVKKGRRYSFVQKQFSAQDLFPDFLSLKNKSQSKIQKILQPPPIQQQTTAFKKLSKVLDDQKNDYLNEGLVNILIKKVDLQLGQKPSSRDQLGMAYSNGKYYVFGGQSQVSFNDLRVLDPSKWEWTQLCPDSASNDLHRRFGHSLCAFKDSLIVFGGAGTYIQKLKRRETYNDVFKFEISIGEWINIGDSNPVKGKSKSLEPSTQDKTKRALAPSKRMGQAAAIYGSSLVIHGGVFGEGNTVLDDFAIFDLESNQWMKMKLTDQCQTNVGFLAYHTMTTVYEPDTHYSIMESRLIWSTPPLEAAKKETLYYKYTGLFIFGGLDEQKMPHNNLYLVKPSYEQNKKYLSSKTGEFKKLVKPKFEFEVVQLIPQGRPPCPRYLHSATKVKDYLIIHGGRNDEIFSEVKNVALNDIHLLDLRTNQWQAVAIYGELPVSRWGHQIVSDPESNSSAALLFGGKNLNSYCDSSIYKFIFDEQQIALYYEDTESKLKMIREEAKK